MTSVSALFEQFIKLGMFWRHLGTLHGGQDGVSGISRPMSALGGCFEPVIMLSGHQHILPAAMAGDLHRLALGLMLELTELALKFEGADGRHEASILWKENARIIRINCLLARGREGDVLSTAEFIWGTQGIVLLARGVTVLGAGMFKLLSGDLPAQ